METSNREWIVHTRHESIRTAETKWRRIWPLALRPPNGLAVMRPFQGLETKDFAAKSLFIDHAIKEDISNWKTKQSKCVLIAKHDISCDETKQQKARPYVQQVTDLRGCYMIGDDCFSCQMMQQALRFWKSCEKRRKDSWLEHDKIKFEFRVTEGLWHRVAKVRWHLYQSLTNINKCKCWPRNSTSLYNLHRRINLTTMIKSLTNCIC